MGRRIGGAWQMQASSRGAPKVVALNETLVMQHCQAKHSSGCHMAKEQPEREIWGRHAEQDTRMLEATAQNRQKRVFHISPMFHQE